VSKACHLAFDLTARDQDLSLAAEIREPVTGVFGPSGAGKTSLLLLLAGIRRPDRGWIEVDGTRLCDTETGAWVPTHARGIAVVFQDGRLFPHKTVAGNLRFGYDRLGPEERRFDLGDIVDLLALGPLMHRRPWQLSGGEVQRVALGRAILSSPRLLLLDEPLASLDRGLRNQILPFLRRVRDQLDLPMIYVAHDLTELLGLTESLMIIEGGRLRAHGSFYDIIRREDVLGLVHDLGLINVHPAEVEENRVEEGVALLRVHWEGSCTFTGHDLEPTKAVTHIGLRPEDIALVRGTVTGLSMQNQLPAVVTHLVASRHKTLCVVDVGRNGRLPLLVEITPRAVRELALAEGQRITCAFKAHAVTYLA